MDGSETGTPVAQFEGHEGEDYVKKAKIALKLASLN